MSPLDRVRAIADAVLLEGYVLYPYRASSAKNRYRWTFGVLAPRAWSEGPAGCEAWWMQTECPLEPGEAGAEIDGALRFLQLQRRTVEALGPAGFTEVDSLDVAGTEMGRWEEGVVHEIAIPPVAIERADGEEHVLPFDVPGGEHVESARDDAGRVIGRVVRRRWPVHAVVRVRAEARGGLRVVRVRVENRTPIAGDELHARREDALRAALLSAHVLLRAKGAAFVSLLDPPASAAEVAASCENVRVHPVLAGEEGERDVILASPIILYDHPRIAPESPGDFFDACEIDALLALRTSTLTPDEKRAARGTDARAAAIVDRVERMAPEEMERLHGVVRELAPIEPRARRYEPGDKVILRPGVRRTDAQDLLYAGRRATIERVMEDVDGRTCLALTVDDDPASELHRWYGRFHYYYLDEVEPIADDAAQ